MRSKLEKLIGVTIFLLMGVFAVVIGAKSLNKPEIGGSFSISFNREIYEAKVTVGEESPRYYVSFENAVSYANLNENTTIEIMKTITSFSEQISITNTIELKSFLGTSINTTNTYAIFDLESSGRLIIKDGVYNTSGPLINSAKGGELVLEGGTYSASNTSAISYTKTEGSSLTVKGEVDATIYLGNGTSQIANEGNSVVNIAVELNTSNVGSLGRTVVTGATSNSTYSNISGGGYALYKTGNEYRLGKQVDITFDPGAQAVNKQANSWTWNAGSNFWKNTKVSSGNSDIKLGTLPIPEREGYTFNGWWTSLASGGESVTTATIIPASNSVFYAKWIENPITVNSINDQTYTGGVIEPLLVVKDAETDELLSKGTHYSVIYSNNVNAGTATATVTGINAYAGREAIKTFTIKQKQATITASDKSRKYSASNPEFTATSTNLVQGHTLEDVTFSTNATSNSNAGDYSITIQTYKIKNGGNDVTGNYAITLIAGTLTITQAENPISVSPSSVSLTGGATAQITVNDYAGNLSYSSNNQNVATVSSSGLITAQIISSQQTATVTVSASGTINYKAGSATVSVTVSAKTYTVDFDGNGSSSGSMTSQTLTFGVSTSLKSNSFSKTGHNFKGWTENSNGTGTLISDGQAYTIGMSNVTLYAKWEPITYYIRYNANPPAGKTATGTTPNSEHTYGSSVYINSNGFSVDGYNFVHWKGTINGVSYVFQEGEIASILNLASQEGAIVDLYAHWSSIFYVSFDLQGGDGISIPMSQVTFSEEGVPQWQINFTYVPNITKYGYKFGGFYSGTNGQGSLIYAEGLLGSDQVPVLFPTDLNRPISSNITVYAYWILLEYNINYVNEKGTNPNPKKYAMKDGVASFTPLSNVSGYTFAGWDRESIAVGTTGDITVTASWNLIYYTIEYDLNGGQVSGSGNPSSYTIETATITLINPTKSGYTFEGWSIPGVGGMGTTVKIEKGSTGNKSYTANWSATSYSITYENTKGASNSNPPSYTSASGKITFSSLPNVPGYTFAGWSPASIAAGSTGNKTVTASWNATSYSITYLGVKGTNPSSNPSSYTINSSTITFAALQSVPEGYIFNGWSPSSISAGSTGNVDVTALWSYKSYSISYSFSRGTNPSTNPSSYTINDLPITFRALNNVPEGYSFSSWSTSSIPVGSTGAKSTTANYSLTSYSLSYTLNGGQVSGNPGSYNIETPTFTLKNPTRTGYTFDGWSIPGIGGMGTNVTINKGSTGNKSYTANWSIISYSITYSFSKGSNPSSNPKTYNVASGTITFASLTSLPAGYKFNGWSPSSISAGSTGNKTITASISLISYSISYSETKGASNSNPSTYTVEDSITFSALGNVSGYNFKSWSPASISKGSTGNKTITATWTAVALPSITFSRTPTGNVGVAGARITITITNTSGVSASVSGGGTLVSNSGTTVVVDIPAYAGGKRTIKVTLSKTGFTTTTVNIIQM